MIDNFAIGLTHLLLAIAAWRLLGRADLDRDPELSDEPGSEPVEAPKPRGARARRA